MIDNSKKVKMIPSQKTSISEKESKEWYIANADYWISLAISSNSKTMTKKFLDAANGIVDEDTYKYVMKNYVEALGEKGKLYGDIRDVDFLTPIKEKYMGEFINMFSNYQVFNNDPTIVLERNKKQAEVIMGWVNQEVVNELNKEGFPTNKPSIDQESIEKLVEKTLDDWVDDIVIKNQDRLELINTITDAKQVYQDAYYYWWTCEEVYTYREVFNNDVYVSVISPLEYYRVDSGNRYVEDDDAGVRKFRMTIPQIIDRFRDELTQKELDYLEARYSMKGERNTVSTHDLILNLDDFSTRKQIFDYSRNAFIDDDLDIDNFLDVYHYVFKTLIKQGILSYYDGQGNIRETIVDETYKVDPSRGDIDIEYEWVNQVWHGWRFGGKISGIYTKPRPIDVQRERFNNISDCKLPYNGMVGLIRENLRNPIPYRILPYLALYRIYTLHQERNVAKFKSWIIFPESILGDSDDISTEERMASAAKDGFFPFDDADANPNALNSIREIATQSLTNYIQLLDALKKQLKDDAWELANMNNARFGNTKDYAGKGVMEYNFANALTGSVWSLESFNGFREKDYMANLDYSRFAWISGKKGSYIDPNTNEVKIVDLEGESSLLENIGIYIRNNNEVQTMLKQMQDLAFAASQNGDLTIAIEAIKGRNITKIAKNIESAIQATREYEQNMARIQEEARAETEKIISQREAEKQAFEANEKQLDRESDERKVAMKLESDERIAEAKLKIDLNGNGYLDKEELALRNSGYTSADVNRLKMDNILNKK